VRLRITLEGRRYDVDVEILPDTGDDAPEDEGLAVPESVLQPPLLPDTRDEDKICRSPIAGMIVEVRAVAGRPIGKGEPLAVIDAMKMHSTIGAPLDGWVEEVMVVSGDMVKPGQILCRLS